MKYLGECGGCGEEWIVETRRDMILFARHLDACERSPHNRPSSPDADPPLSAGAPGGDGLPRPTSGASGRALSSRVSGDLSPASVPSSGNAAGGQSRTTPSPRDRRPIPGAMSWFQLGLVVPPLARQLIAETEDYLKRAAS